MGSVEDPSVLGLASVQVVHRICYHALMSNVKSQLGPFETGRDLQGSEVCLGLGLGCPKVLGNVLRNFNNKNTQYQKFTHVGHQGMGIPGSGVGKVLRNVVVASVGDEMLGSRHCDRTLRGDEASQFQGFLYYLLLTALDDLGEETNPIGFGSAKGLSSVRQFANQGVVASDTRKVCE